MINLCNEEDEEPHNITSSCFKKKCKFLSWIRKDAGVLSGAVDCRAFHGKMPSSFSPTPQEEEYPNCDFDDEHEVSEIITRYMEAKTKRKTTGTSSTNFRLKYLIFPLGDIDNTLKPLQHDQKGRSDNINDELAEEESFLTPRSGLSRCSSSASSSSLETFVTAMDTAFSTKSKRSTSSSSSMDIERRNLMIHQLRDCEGWPFGLCRKALLLPPLPKSPSDSWLWCNKSAAKL